MPPRDPLTAARDELRDHAKTYPLATEDHPWGETAMKVKGKAFVFLSLYKGQLFVTMKLPTSGTEALRMSFAKPSGYGLGKHGWVTSTFAPGDTIPLDVLRDWIDESYRAVAPKSVLAKMEKDEPAMVVSFRPSKKPGKKLR